MKTQVPVHRYAIGDLVSVDVHDVDMTKLNPFTIEAQMPPVGVFLQYRIKSGVETCRRVVAEHQLNSAGHYSLAASTVSDDEAT